MTYRGGWVLLSLGLAFAGMVSALAKHNEESVLQMIFAYMIYRDEIKVRANAKKD